MGKRFQTVAAMACMKSLLMVFNILFWISGAAICLLAIWMEVKLVKYMEFSSEFSSAIPYVLMIIGGTILVMGTLACCCTVKGQPVLLYVYGGFLAIIFVLELGAGVSTFAYRNKLIAGFDRGLNDSMANYKSVAQDKVSDFDAMQETLHCCGNRGSNDWLYLVPAIPIPQSCCISDINCDTAVESEIYTQGCYDKVIGFLDANIGLVAGVAVGVAFFPLIGVILSCCLARFANKAKYEQMA